MTNTTTPNINTTPNTKLTDYLPPDWKTRYPRDLLSRLDDSFDRLTSISMYPKLCSKTEKEIYPICIDNIFRIFNLCSYTDIKVVILGQDPYYAKREQANGIAFSVNCSVSLPPSLKNILRELNAADTNLKPSCQTCKKGCGDLSYLIEKGVFLLNTALTVESGKPNSHLSVWKEFIEITVSLISQKGNVMFCLWGAGAQSYEKFIRCPIIKCSHPSPLSAYKTSSPFIGSGIFRKINDHLNSMNSKELD